MKKIVLLILFSALVLFGGFLVQADSVDDRINQAKKDLDSLTLELKNKEANYGELNKKLTDIKASLVILASQIKQKAVEARQGEEALAYQKELLNARTRSYYKNIGRTSLSLLELFIASDLGKSLENFFYQRSLVDEDKNTIIKTVFYIKDLEQKKLSLEHNQQQLADLNAQIDKQAQALAGEIVVTKQKIAQVTALQQQLLAQKLASLNIPRTASTSLSGCVDDRNIDPGFSPRLAFFTYGTPNRVGLNQYGAKGRAESGQNEETILRAYYNFDSLSDVDVNTKIRVDGHAEYSLEDYVKRIYEMPADWAMEALKAQAIAARSYVMAYTNNGSGSICDSQNCQVFKDEEKGGRWNEAVEATRGKVMTQGGQPIKAWYSSTHGGFILSSSEIGWSGTNWTKHGVDTPSGSVGSLSDLQNNAFDKSSPWFYCDWGARAQYNKTAWLKTDEVADIVNTILLARADSSTREHLYQPDQPNPEGKETWGMQRVKDELRSRGVNPINNVTDVSMSTDLGAGRTTSVSISSDAGGFNFDGAEFKNYFNLRAPANIQIVGPLFVSEKR